MKKAAGERGRSSKSYQPAGQRRCAARYRRDCNFWREVDSYEANDQAQRPRVRTRGQRLKGNQGDQNYDLPAATDLNKYQAVAICCERFRAIFGVARLEKL